MGGFSRSKGARREVELVNMHRLLGLKAERVPLSGGMRYRGGGHDIDVYPWGDDAAPWIGEVKARGSGEGFKQIEAWLGDYDFLALWRDRARPLIVLPWPRWEDALGAMKKRGVE